MTCGYANPKRVVRLTERSLVRKFRISVYQHSIMWLHMLGVPRIFPIAKRRRMAVIAKASFALSYADLSAVQNPPQFFALGPPIPLGPKLPKLRTWVRFPSPAP